jgi:hypothetical protein
VKRTALTAYCAVAIILWGGCNRPTSTHPVDTHAVDSTHTVDSTLTVEQLLANPQEHSHAVVKVRGCLMRGFEVLVLEPCDSPSRKQSIWLDDATMEQELTKINRLHPEYNLHPGAKLFFQFDEPRNSRAWKKLDASFKDHFGFASDVVLVGQFETGSRFGHMGGYMHELILVDVLDNKSNGTQ